MPILAATVLTDGECVIRDVPGLTDVAIKVGILRRLGLSVRPEMDEGLAVLRVRTPHVVSPEVPGELMRCMRSSIVLMGSLLGRMGRVRVSYPGGCAIGPRPIDFHLKAFAAMGADIRETGGYIEASARQLRGAVIQLDRPSVGATENVMLAAVLARGATEIRNAAREPEISDLAGFLNAMGARVAGAGTDVIVIRGVEGLRGADYRIIPDRIEAGTYLVAAAITGGDLLLENVVPKHLEAAIAKLAEAGARIAADGNRISIQGPDRPRALDLKTMPYPGFPTDLQSQFMALLSLADGTSIITETIFENRFRVAAELGRMGAGIAIDGRVAIIRGVSRLTGAMVEAMDDLRGGAALALAALAAEGVSVIEGVQHIERGYEDMDRKLLAVGARITKGAEIESPLPAVGS